MVNETVRMTIRSVVAAVILMAGNPQCYTRCNDMYAMDQQACNPEDNKCLAAAVVRLELCEEACSQDD